ncbi:unnamed protein product [Acanthoscelides obtectus]|uniref:Uncharacterized protein n=1 Tax=Acanthoscelides obtectus TaxID=200917 RepID=A0A9P0L147_ACAOB|nr:unnamed protein product [Acanthoscelides obtectus]CAK1666434.1 hypothetical protein AOBTE_LOCUS25327 [Acanthoscelides obtectus]
MNQCTINKSYSRHLNLQHYRHFHRRCHQQSYQLIRSFFFTLSFALPFSFFYSVLSICFFLLICSLLFFISKRFSFSGVSVYMMGDFFASIFLAILFLTVAPLLERVLALQILLMKLRKGLHCVKMGAHLFL